VYKVTLNGHGFWELPVSKAGVEGSSGKNSVGNVPGMSCGGDLSIRKGFLGTLENIQF
jgi:hypothetical protein